MAAAGTQLEYRFIYAPNPYSQTSNWEPVLPGMSLPLITPAVEVQFREVPRNKRHPLYEHEFTKAQAAGYGHDFGTDYEVTTDEVLDAFALAHEIAEGLDA